MGESEASKNRDGGVPLALQWPLFNTLHTTINLKSALAVEGKMVRKRGRVGTCGGDVLSLFGAANGVMGKLREGGCRVCIGLKWPPFERNKQQLTNCGGDNKGRIG